MQTVLHIFGSFGIGGAQRRAADLMNAFKAEQRHIIVAIDGGTDALALIEPGVEIECREIQVRSSRGLALDNWQRLRRHLQAIRPDWLVTYNFGTIDAALANRLRPVCRHLHFEDGFGPDEALGRQLPRRVWLRRLALSGNARIIVPSRTLERIATETWRFKRSRVCHIANGIDIARFARAKPVEGLRQAEHERLIGSVGVLRPEKRFDRLLRVFAGLAVPQPVRLVIAGDGPERSALEALAHQLNIADRVSFLGHMERPEAVLAALDVFALTSDTEQMPYSLVEAMAQGLPLVATDVGDVRSMLPEPALENAIVAPADEDGFAASLRQIVQAPASRSEGNRLHAERHFSIQAMLDRYRTVFEIAS